MFTIKEINKACFGKLIYNNLKNIDYVSINSKDIKDNTLFIAIKGKYNDAHKFIDDAIKNKVCACIISKKYKYYKKIIKKLIDNNISVILVNNTTNAFINLAKYNRYKNYNTKVIAITGSNGKTSCKELIYDILSTKYNVIKNIGNLNNIYGVCKTILNLNNHDILIIELGMNHIKEISFLSLLVKPNISIITNIGSAHIGKLGSINKILKAKLEILDGMDNKLLYVNSNNEILNKYNNDKINLIKYKYDSITYNKHHYYLTCYNKKIKVKDTINPSNVVISYLISYKFNINYKTFLKCLNKHKSPNMRLEVIKRKNNTIISDCYNSNYESLINGIDYTIRNYKNNKIILIIGDILELGKYTKYYHIKISKYINKYSNYIYKIIFVGNYVKYSYDNIYGIKKVLIKDIKDIKLDNIYKYVYYIKGSRKIGLDKLIDKIN